METEEYPIERVENILGILLSLLAPVETAGNRVETAAGTAASTSKGSQ